MKFIPRLDILPVDDDGAGTGREAVSGIWWTLLATVPDGFAETSAVEVARSDCTDEGAFVMEGRAELADTGAAVGD